MRRHVGIVTCGLFLQHHRALLCGLTARVCDTAPFRLWRLIVGRYLAGCGVRSTLHVCESAKRDVYVCSRGACSGKSFSKKSQRLSAARLKTQGSPYPGAPRLNQDSPPCCLLPRATARPDQAEVSRLTLDSRLVSRHSRPNAQSRVAESLRFFIPVSARARACRPARPPSAVRPRPCPGRREIGLERSRTGDFHVPRRDRRVRAQRILSEMPMVRPSTAPIRCLEPHSIRCQARGATARARARAPALRIVPDSTERFGDATCVRECAQGMQRRGPFVEVSLTHAAKDPRPAK